MSNSLSCLLTNIPCFYWLFSSQSLNCGCRLNNILLCWHSLFNHVRGLKWVLNNDKIIFAWSLLRLRFSWLIFQYWSSQFQNLSKRWCLCILSLVKKEMNEDLQNTGCDIHLLFHYRVAPLTTWKHLYVILTLS